MVFGYRVFSILFGYRVFLGIGYFKFVSMGILANGYLRKYAYYTRISNIRIRYPQCKHIQDMIDTYTSRGESNEAVKNAYSDYKMFEMEWETYLRKIDTVCLVEL